MAGAASSSAARSTPRSTAPRACSFPPELRDAAGLNKDVLLIGTGRRLELWDKQRHEAVEARVVAAGMTDEVLDLSL